MRQRIEFPKCCVVINIINRNNIPSLSNINIVIGNSVIRQYDIINYTNIPY